MTITVTENPLVIRNAWQVPSTQAPGYPIGRLIWQSHVDGVVIAARVAEDTVVTINGAFPIGYSYRMERASVRIQTSAADDRWGRHAAGLITAFSPAVPANSLGIPFNLVAEGTGNITDPNTPTLVSGSATPEDIFYEGYPPSQPFQAQSATTVFQVALAADVDSADAAVLRYYMSALIYTINDDEQYRIQSPVPVI